MLRLSHDNVLSVAQHLRPRHVLPLLTSCKKLNKIIDCDDYWARPAIHAVCRNLDEMEMKGVRLGSKQFEPLGGLFDLINLSGTYKETIDEIIRRARIVLAVPKLSGIVVHPHYNIKSLAQVAEFLVYDSLLSLVTEPDADDDLLLTMFNHYNLSADNCKALMKREVEIDYASDLTEPDTLSLGLVRRLFRELDDMRAVDRMAKVTMTRMFARMLHKENDFIEKKFSQNETVLTSWETVFTNTIYACAYDSCASVGQAATLGDWFCMFYFTLKGTSSYELFDFERFACSIERLPYY